MIPPLRNTFSSLHHRNFRLFFIGQSISNSGNWLTNVALTLWGPTCYIGRRRHPRKNRKSRPEKIERESARRRIVIMSNVRGRDLGSFVAEVREARPRDHAPDRVHH